MPTKAELQEQVAQLEFEIQKLKDAAEVQAGVEVGLGQSIALMSAHNRKVDTRLEELSEEFSKNIRALKCEARLPDIEYETHFDIVADSKSVKAAYA
jgi:hypothetical protein